MKKIILMVVILFAMIATTTQVYAQQYSVRRIVHAQFVAGTLTVPNDTICASGLSQQITGSLATGGQPTPANTYQWQISTSITPTWTNIITGIGQNLMTGSLAPGNYSYRRIDTNPGCGSKDTTNTVSIHVWNTFLAGTATGGGNFCYNVPGTTTTCTSATGGDPATITQVMQTSPDGITWTTTGNTTLSYTPAGPMVTKEYVRWIFTSNCGTATTNVILYNVYLPFVAGTASTTTVTPLCNGANGGTVSTTLATGGAPTTTIEWETSPDGLVWTNTSNTTITLVLGNLTADKYVRCRYMNNCDTLWSNVLYFQVYAILAHGGIPTFVGANDTICLNTDPGTIDAPAATGGVPLGTTYQWQTSVNMGTFANILVNGTSEDYDIPTLTISGSHRYQRIATNACNGSVTSPMISIFVYPVFNAGVVGNHEEICSGIAQSTIIQLTPATGGSGSYTYQWIVSTDNEATWSNAPGVSTNATYTPATTSTPVDIIYYYRRMVTDVNSCGAAPSTAPILP